MNNLYKLLLCLDSKTYIIKDNRRNELMKKLQLIVSDKKNETNLYGKIKNENEFILKNKLTIGFYSNGGGDPAILRGIFIDNSTLRIKVNSAFGFPFFSLVLPIFFTLIALNNGFESNTEAILAVIFSFLFGFASNRMGNYYKKRLINDTINALKLNK